MASLLQAASNQGSPDDAFSSSLEASNSDEDDLEDGSINGLGGGQKSPFKAEGDRIIGRQRTLPSRKINLHHILQELVVVISDLTAACLNIERVVGQTYNHTFHHFAVYLQVLEVYGCGYAEDIDGRGYKIRDTKSHKLSAIKLLQDI